MNKPTNQPTNQPTNSAQVLTMAQDCAFTNPSMPASPTCSWGWCLQSSRCWSITARIVFESWADSAYSQPSLIIIQSDRLIRSRRPDTFKPHFAVARSNVLACSGVIEWSEIKGATMGQNITRAAGLIETKPCPSHKLRLFPPLFVW